MTTLTELIRFVEGEGTNKWINFFPYLRGEISWTNFRFNRALHFYHDYENIVDHWDDGKIVFDEVRLIYKQILQSSNLARNHPDAYKIFKKINIEDEIIELCRRYDMDNGEYFTHDG